MSAQFKFPVTWDAMHAMVARLTGGQDPADYVEAQRRRDVALEDFLNNLPWLGTVTTGAANPTDANGRIVVPHGLGYVPSVVAGWSMGPDGGALILATVICTAPTLTTFTARLLDNAGAPIAAAASIANPCTFGWMAAP